jgi:hypothetical protein
MVVFGALMIGTAVWATPKEQRWTRPAAAPALASSAEDVPQMTGTYWLKRDPKVDRELRLAKFVSYAMAALALGSLVYATLGLSSEICATCTEQLAAFEELKQALLLAELMFLALPLIMHVALRSMRQSLGTDGKSLYVKLEDGRQKIYMPEQLVYGHRKILHQDHLIAIQTGNRKSLYLKGEIETYIAPLLRSARKMSTFELLRYQFQYRESTLMANICLTVLLVSFVLMTGMWREVLP